MSRFVDEIFFSFTIWFVFLLSSKFSIIIMMIMIMIIKRSDHKFNDMINSKFTHTHTNIHWFYSLFFFFAFALKGTEWWLWWNRNLNIVSATKMINVWSRFSYCFKHDSFFNNNNKNFSLGIFLWVWFVYILQDRIVFISNFPYFHSNQKSSQIKIILWWIT